MFLINVPVIAVALVAIALVVPTSRDTTIKRFDPIGTLASIAGIGTLVWAVIEGPEGLLEKWQGPLIERFRLGVPAQRLVEHRQIAQSHGHVRMLWPQEALLYGQGLLVEPLSLGILPAGV